MSSGDSQYLSTHRIDSHFNAYLMPVACCLPFMLYGFILLAFCFYFPRCLLSANRLHYIRNQLSVERGRKNSKTKKAYSPAAAPLLGEKKEGKIVWTHMCAPPAW